MIVEKAVDIYESYLKENTRPNTVRSFFFTLERFRAAFFGREMESITESDIIDLVSGMSERCSTSTKSGRVSAIRAFFNFVIEVTEAEYHNPCQRPIIRKLFRTPRASSPKLLDKDLVDEIIFRTTNERDRLFLELMGRGGMRVGEVLQIKAGDINPDNATIQIAEPKSGRAGEKVYITKKLCSRLLAYARKREIDEDSRIFSISYSTAHRMVKNAAGVVNAKLRPHDLRRHAATQASRNSVPLEIVSKVILRHADLATTQRYLGAIDANEASRWVEHLNR